MTLAISLIGVLMAALFFYGPWQTFCGDWGRQRIFEIRDEIFDMAAAGEVSFADPRYVAIRRSLNLMIRFMHEVTWPRLVYLLVASRLFGIPLRASALERAVTDLPDAPFRRSVERKMERMGQVLVGVVVWRSPILIGLVPILIVFSAVADTVARLRALRSRAFRGSFCVVQRDAELVESGLALA